MDVTAVLVTRGDIDLSPVLDSLPDKWPVVIWDNSERPVDLKVYGHFGALAEVETEFVYMQDDDAICPAAELRKAWMVGGATFHGRYLYNEKGEETPWISWGGIFHRDLPWPAIDRFVSRYGWSDDVLLWCDLIFGCLTPSCNIDLGWENLPHFRAENRMVMQPGHYAEQGRIRELCAAL